MGKSKKRQRSRDNSEGRKLSRHELIKRMERLICKRRSTSDWRSRSRSAERRGQRGRGRSRSPHSTGSRTPPGAYPGPSRVVTARDSSDHISRNRERRPHTTNSRKIQASSSRILPVTSSSRGLSMASASQGPSRASSSRELLRASSSHSPTASAPLRDGSPPPLSINNSPLPSPAVSEASSSPMIQNAGRSTDPVPLTNEGGNTGLNLTEVLGEVVVTEPPPARNLSEPIALRWSRIAENGLPREVVEALLLKYPTPENCGQLRAIQLNPEVAAGMANDRLARDNFNADIQHQISRTLCAVGRSLTLMLEENNLPSNLREEALTPLGDAGRLLANLLNRITVARRKLVIPTLNPNVRDVLAKTTATDLLFGSDISEQIKAAKSLHTTGKELRQTAVRSQTKGAFTTSKYKKPNEGASSKTSSLNRQGPVRRARPATKPQGRASREYRTTSRPQRR
ncbi:unnamed protein product [Callosobruchus maculatus]|uniref:Uncharacterized protein n=1 Tax=Callosobruchus maculatus TaxID=64391 RepID=A0A653DFV5_CALMS|nr:unnamed protein product [Callosobruchus maculatus]